jgi:hypothetical protein
LRRRFFAWQPIPFSGRPARQLYRLAESLHQALDSHAVEVGKSGKPWAVAIEDAV